MRLQLGVNLAGMHCQWRTGMHCHWRMRNWRRLNIVLSSRLIRRLVWSGPQPELYQFMVDRLSQRSNRV